MDGLFEALLDAASPGFHATTFAIVEVTIVVLAGVVAYATSPRARKHRATRRA